MTMNENLQKAWDEFMQSDEFANAMVSYAPPEYLETVLQAVFTSRFRVGLEDAAELWKKEREARESHCKPNRTSCANSHSHRHSTST
jgi:hypothetical protein